MLMNALKPSRTIVTSFNPRKVPLANDHNNSAVSSPYDEGEWVLCLAASSDTIACALSNGEVQVYDQERLHVTRTFPRSAPVMPTGTAPPPITSLVYGAASRQQTQQNPSILLSTDASGALEVMDLRQGQRTIRATLPSAALSLALGYDGGHLAAVGSTRGRIYFSDLRQPGSLLGTYVDSHTDDVTQVQFSPYQPTLLLSGAEDGLLSVFDTTQPTEETACQSICNVGTAVRHTGFCGPRHLYCLTGSETLSLWDASTATLVRDYGWDTRGCLSKAAGGMFLEYLVDAYWKDATQQLVLMAGTATGDSAVFHLASSSTLTEDSFQMQCFCQGGHRGVVRAWSPLSDESVFVTAGEDARLCEWRPSPLFNSTPPPQPSRPAAKRPSLGGGGPQRRQRTKTGASPY